MKHASLKLQPVGYPIYRMISQLNRQFEDQVGSLDNLMGFEILPAAKLRAYQVMLEEVRALINEDLHEVLAEREFNNSAYYEHLRLKWQQQFAHGERTAPAQSPKCKPGQKRRDGTTGRKKSQPRKAVRP